MHVVRVEALPDPEPVYNLTIEGAGEFFAAGVLVHNCDAARYGAFSWEHLTDESTKGTRWDVARRLSPAQEREMELRRLFAAGKRVGDS